MVVTILISQVSASPTSGQTVFGWHSQVLLVYVLKFQFSKPQCWKHLVIVESSGLRYVIPRIQNLPKLQTHGGDVILVKGSFALQRMSQCVVGGIHSTDNFARH